MMRTLYDSIYTAAREVHNLCTILWLSQHASKGFEIKFYHKFPKYSDTKKFAVITLKVERDGVSLESRSSLIWVCTVCQYLSVQKLRKITVKLYSGFKHDFKTYSSSRKNTVSNFKPRNETVFYLKKCRMTHSGLRINLSYRSINIILSFHVISAKKVKISDSWILPKTLHSSRTGSKVA